MLPQIPPDPVPVPAPPELLMLAMVAESVVAVTQPYTGLHGDKHSVGKWDKEEGGKSCH